MLNYLPKTLQPKAKAALHESWMAETREHALVAFKQFTDTFAESGRPGCASESTKGDDVLLKTPSSNDKICVSPKMTLN